MHLCGDAVTGAVNEIRGQTSRLHNGTASIVNLISSDDSPRGKPFADKAKGGITRADNHSER
jgi:hypothetical protein